MTKSQAPILAGVPSAGRFVTLGLRGDADATRVRNQLTALDLDDSLAVGLGAPLVTFLGASLAGLRPLPSFSGPGFATASTQGALWLFVGGNDPGVVLQRTRAVLSTLGDDYLLEEDVPSFSYRGGRDLSGYEDGTENPHGDAATEAAIMRDSGPGLDGSSFAAVQRWIHDLRVLEALSPDARDHIVGRHRETNEELEDAPASAHVKRSAQESYEPAAFMVRRSMPWGNVTEHGLYFVAYGVSLDPFERVLRRMVGLEDGISDALFRFSRAVSGGYYWCPPLREGRLDLRALVPAA